jgi:hypothetical protein
MGVTLSLLGGLSLLGALSLLGGLPGSAGAAGGVPETGFRHQASIEVLQPGAFVQLPLPASAHVRSMQAGLADLRVVDAEGQRVPFALLAPRAQETQHTERLDDAALYPLPARPAPGNAWASPLEVVVQGRPRSQLQASRRDGCSTWVSASAICLRRRPCAWPGRGRWSSAPASASKPVTICRPGGPRGGGR